MMSDETRFQFIKPPTFMKSGESVNFETVSQRDHCPWSNKLVSKLLPLAMDRLLKACFESYSFDLSEIFKSSERALLR